MTILMVSLVLLAAALLVGGAWGYSAYRRDLRASRDRLRTGSRVVETSCGPIEYAELGDGAPVLVVHGAGGGFDQGIELGRSFANRGFRVIAMSRFGYLQTPLPADPSPAAQADAHASLMDALEIPRAAIFGGSAGAPSAMQFAIRHPDRCAALILLVPMAYKDPDVGHSAPNLSPLAQKILMTIVGSDLAFWLASRLARDMVIEKGPCHAARARQDGEPGRASPCFPRSGDD